MYAHIGRIGIDPGHSFAQMLLKTLNGSKAIFLRTASKRKKTVIQTIFVYKYSDVSAKSWNGNICTSGETNSTLLLMFGIVFARTKGSLTLSTSMHDKEDLRSETVDRVEIMGVRGSKFRNIAY